MSEFKLCHKRGVIRGVRDKWLKQYKDWPDDRLVGVDRRLAARGRSVSDISNALAALDLETCSSADVDAAIGTGGWAKNACDHCNGDFEVILRLGETSDYEASWS